MAHCCSVTVMKGDELSEMTLLFGLSTCATPVLARPDGRKMRATNAPRRATDTTTWLSLQSGCSLFIFFGSVDLFGVLSLGRSYVRPVTRSQPTGLSVSAGFPDSSGHISQSPPIGAATGQPRKQLSPDLFAGTRRRDQIKPLSRRESKSEK